MSSLQTPCPATADAATIGTNASGLLVLVVGPSGAGKDALLDAARRAFAGDAQVHFATRTITRAVEAGGEQYEPMSAVLFDEAARDGAFALVWRANGLAYGVRHRTLQPLSNGNVLVLNTSRAAIPQARRIAPRVAVLHVTAPLEVLAERISRRGRETAREASDRLARRPALDAGGLQVIEIDNGGSLEAGETAFVEALRLLVSRSRAEPWR